jgi:hypothetical protein
MSKPSAPLFGGQQRRSHPVFDEAYGQGVVSTRTLKTILDLPSVPAVRRWLERRELLDQCFRDGGRLLVPVDILEDQIPGLLEASRRHAR